MPDFGLVLGFVDGVGSMSHRPTVAVFGSNDLSDSPDVQQLCEDLGRSIVDLGCRVACGGLGGVMSAVCKGARSSARYTEGDTIGILPMGDFESANEFIDVIIPTGLGLFRNMLVARAGDACIGVKGGSGTLSEIAFAWQIKKPVAVMSSSGGWSADLAGTRLDHRRIGTDVTDLPNVAAAEQWLKDTLDI
jgi:uncharacterized protein (TIGR00725 family)